MEREIINPDIWKISDEKYEATFNLSPMEVNLAILGCVENGRRDMVKEIAGESTREYIKSTLPEKDRWVHTMCFVCGAALACAVRGGLSLNRATAVANKYIDLSQNIETPDEFAERQINMYLDYAVEVGHTRSVKTENRVVNTAINYIDDNIDDKITIDKLSQVCSYSKSRLQHLFIQHTGLTVTDYIRSKKAEKACFLLEYTDMSCTKIAEKLSYSSQSYFISRFRLEMGLTPARYRRDKTTQSRIMTSSK